VIIAAPAAAVWVALTDPGELVAWFGAEVEMDLRPGGSVRFRWADGIERRGLVIELDPPHRFAFRWRELRSAATGLAVSDATIVEFLVEAVAGGTRVRVTESPGVATERPFARARVRT
jgi:uncharacterized protein YndB with AHSA1/START domain